MGKVLVFKAPSSPYSQTTGSWKPFELYANRFQKFSEQLAVFQQALLRIFSDGHATSLNYPFHRSQIVEMTNSWKESQEFVVDLLLDIPATKRRLLSGYVDTLKKNLPLIDEKSCALQQNLGELSLLVKDAKKAFRKVSIKLDERARWYRAHPTLYRNT